MMDEKTAPVIVLPEDEARRIQLHQKLEEYRKRRPHTSDEYWDRMYKVRVLELLLKDRMVDTNKLSLELEREFDYFNYMLFNNACAVIEDYCSTGGKNAKGGTGLPPPPMQANP